MTSTSGLIRDGGTANACGADPSPNQLGRCSTHHSQEIAINQAPFPTFLPQKSPSPKSPSSLLLPLVSEPLAPAHRCLDSPLRSPISPPDSSPRSSPATTPLPCVTALPRSSPRTIRLPDYALSAQTVSYITTTSKRNQQPLEYKSGRTKRFHASFRATPFSKRSPRSESFVAAQPLSLATKKMADFGNFNDSRYPRFNAAYTQSEPHTPVDQIPVPGSNPYENTARFGSVSSIATTDDDDATNEIQYAWTPQQDQLVRNAYDEYTKMPQTTPFSGRYVPSGAVNRVAKNTLKLAKQQQIHFPHSINAVRRRVGTLFNPEPENMEELQQISAPDYFSMIPHDLGNNESRLPKDLSANADDFNFFDNNSALRKLSVEEKYAHKLTPAGLGDLVTTPRYNEPSARGKHLEPSLVTRRGTNANNIGAYNQLDSPFSRSPINRSPTNRSPTNNSPSNHSPKAWGSNGTISANSLAAPFKELRPTVLPPPVTLAANQMVEEEVINIVAKRKRDSLRMKRGQI